MKVNHTWHGRVTTDWDVVRPAKPCSPASQSLALISGTRSGSYPTVGTLTQAPPTAQQVIKHQPRWSVAVGSPTIVPEGGTPSVLPVWIAHPRWARVLKWGKHTKNLSSSKDASMTSFMIQGFIKSYMQNILLTALAKDQCKNTPQFCNCQLKKVCSSGRKAQHCVLASELGCTERR